MTLRLWLVCAAVLASCSKPVPSKVESGFDMASHAMSFANFAAGYDEATMTPESMQRMFGTGVCKNQSSPCELTLAAKGFMAKANKAMQGGRCEGFAVLSSMMQANRVSAVDFGGQTARDLSLNDNAALQRELAYWFTTQLHPMVAEKTKGYHAKEVMPFLAEALAKDAKERYRIGIVKKSNGKVSGGHALTPIAYYKGDRDGLYLLQVYDNNDPDKVRTMRIDTKANRWEYEASENPSKKSSLYYGDDTNKNPLYFAPIFTRVGELPCHFCTGAKAQITTSGGAQVVVNETGVTEGEISSSGGGSVSPTFSALNDEDGTSWNVFVDGSSGLKVSITPGDDGSSTDQDQASVEITGSTFNAAVSGLKLDQADSWNVSADGREQTYTNNSGTSLTLTGAVEKDGQVVQVTTTVDGASETVGANIKENGQVEVSAKGAMGSSVTVQISVTDTSGTTKSGTVSFTSQGDATLNSDSTQLAMSGTISGTVNNGGTMEMLGNACTDGRLSGMESDVDCGGTCDVKCAVGERCTGAADCRSTFCNATTMRCVRTQCEDERKTGDESDVDCGGATCGKCAAGKTCASSLDCATGLTCDATVCKPSYVVSVTVSGLPTADSLELTNATSGDMLVVSTNDVRAFPTRAVGVYSVSISRQPSTATCTVMDGSGTATADVVITVSCTPTFGVSGSVSGLDMGKSLTLVNNGADPVTLTADGPFVFATRITGAYAVTVQTQPMDQSCTVTNGSGTATADVTNVTISCGPSGFAVAGSVSGLDMGKTLTLVNNGADPVTVTMNGAFTFPLRVSGAYNVAVQTQPMNQTCTVTNGAGTATANITNVSVSCGPSGFAVGGNVSGLPASRSFTLLINGGNPLSVSMNGPFTFSGFYQAYTVTIGTPPTGATCTLSNATGTATAAVTNLGVTCVNTSGTLDTTFNTNGWYSNSPTIYHNEWYRVAVNPDNSMVWVGRNQVGGADEDWGITKLTAAGVPDTTFGTNGYLGINRGITLNERARAIHRNSDGTYLVAGSLHMGATGLDYGVAKVTAGGTLDMTFGTAGVVTHDYNTSNQTLMDMKVLSDGSMVLVGTIGTDVLVMKLTSAGALDMGFGTNGSYLLATAADEGANAVDVRSTGDIFIAGYTNASGNYNTLIISLNSMGTENPMFGSSGILDVDLSGANLDDRANDIDLENGNPTIVGSAVVSGNSNYLLAQFNNFNGAPTSYGNSGVVLIDRAGANDRATALRYIPSTGGFMVGGISGVAAMVVKLGNSGLVDTSFGNMGQFVHQMGGPNATPNDLAFDSLGRIIIGGTFTIPGGNNPDFGAARINP